MMKQSRLVWDFMIQVVGEKFRLKDMSFGKMEASVFLMRLQEQDDYVASWSPSTIDKIRQVLIKILVENEYLDNTNSDHLSLPEDTIDLRVRRDHVPYDTWLGRGQVIATEGNVIHYGYIENFIEDLGTKYHIKEIAFDRWGAVQMVQNLEGMGFTVVPFGQGFKDMSPPTKELMKLVLEQKIAHGGNVPLRWMMDNVYVRTDPAGNIKMDKEKSTERIDGAVATVMALDRAIRNEGSTDSVYNERGIIVI